MCRSSAPGSNPSSPSQVLLTLSNLSTKTLPTSDHPLIKFLVGHFLSHALGCLSAI